MKEISENYKKALENLDALSDGEERKFQSSRSSYSKKKPKDLLLSVLSSKANRVHIPKSCKKAKKPKKLQSFVRKQEIGDLSEIFLQLTSNLEQKENKENVSLWKYASL